jgi:hypothetical protein
MANDKIVLGDRALAREISQVLEALKSIELTEEQRQRLREHLCHCLDQLTSLLGLRKGAEI